LVRRGLLITTIAVVPLLALGAFGVIRAMGDDAQGAPGPQGGSVLNPHPAAGPFEVDDTTIDDCGALNADARVCYEQSFGNLAYRSSAKQALAEVVTRGATVTEVTANCHRIAHTIGAAVLAREDGDVSTALSEGDSTCWSGFYHGLLERALAPARSTGELGRLIRDLCDPAGKNWSSFTHYQCLHGIGHGLMLRTGYQRDLSLDLCTRLPDTWSRQSCDGGVFMEGFSPSLGDKPPPFDSRVPLAPCPSVADVHKLYCYLQVADNLVRGYGYDWKKVADACATEADAQWRAYCFQSYGRQASGNNYGRPSEVAALCAIAGGLGESDCVYGAVRDIASNAASGAPAATFCGKVSSLMTSRCFEGMGTIIATLETEESAIRSRCQQFGGDYRDDCVRGAGLTQAA
jgi:hypothetical protein